MKCLPGGSGCCAGHGQDKIQRISRAIRQRANQPAVKRRRTIRRFCIYQHRGSSDGDLLLGITQFERNVDPAVDLRL